MHSELLPEVDPAFASDVVAGLSQPIKQIPSKYFYDQRGSRLFDQICELDEYYLTRTEQAIMDQYAREMAEQLGERVMLIEFGSGSSNKTQAILEQLVDPAAYVPLDISEDHLQMTAEELRKQFPDIEILPVVADFTRGFKLPTPSRPASHAAVYFPGSTVGNLAQSETTALLNNVAGILGDDGGLLIGIDLIKDPDLINAAYNDSEGVTADFNLNVLQRINSELNADFHLDQFEHLAQYNPKTQRVETFIVSEANQSVSLLGDQIEFSKGEKIITEVSHKYTIGGFEKLASQSGFTLHKSWTDANEWFAVLHLVQENKSPSESR